MSNNQSKTTNRLILDEKALEELGLNSEVLYVCEYDLYSERYLTDADKRRMNTEQKDANKRFNKLARIVRNKMVFTLKFKLDATKNLERSWFIDGDKLDEAVKEIEEIKATAKQKGFSDIDERIKVIPLITDNIGAEHYEDKKMEFLLQFIMEHVEMVEKGLKTKRIAQSSLWRSKKAVEIVSSHSETMKAHERYNELQDEINMLDELNGQCESFLTDAKEKRIKEKAKEENKK
jgi:hypothetical protein